MAYSKPPQIDNQSPIQSKKSRPEMNLVRSIPLAIGYNDRNLPDEFQGAVIRQANGSRKRSFSSPESRSDRNKKKRTNKDRSEGNIIYEKVDEHPRESKTNSL